ncbi:hypothetical protein [Nannocystis punicea]|uniref:Vitamin K epoxide reductase family protein n=1 Tax=Nannocystis punicea TaxID=2995304 RepID=A0ABY7H5R7_9BACT|nr:hypothetical protein [Nannocystis poenicansa]WAS94620.1 hypothetical protein O0S08_00535 [Nannocystis poenicansa]
MNRRAVPLAALIVVGLASPTLAAPVQHDSSVMVEEPFSPKSAAPPTSTVQQGSSAPEAPLYYAWPAPAAPAANTAQQPPPPRRRKGLMIGGWVAFGTLYTLTAGVTLLFVALDDYDPYPSPCTDDSPCYPDPGIPRAINRMYIPVVGPFAALPVGETHRERFQIVLPGVLQVVALSLAIVGTVQFVRDGRGPRVADADGFKLGKRLRLGVTPTRLLDGGALTLGGHF